MLDVLQGRILVGDELLLTWRFDGGHLGLLRRCSSPACLSLTEGTRRVSLAVGALVLFYLVAHDLADIASTVLGQVGP